MPAISRYNYTRDCITSSQSVSMSLLGAVRLVDGDNYDTTEGHVEYCVGGLWGTVCNYMWTLADVIVVCRQLGLNTIGKAIVIFSFPVSWIC